MERFLIEQKHVDPITKKITLRFFHVSDHNYYECFNYYFFNLHEKYKNDPNIFVRIVDKNVNDLFLKWVDRYIYKINYY